MKILLYASIHNRIGGVERFNLNFCKRMSKLCELTFVYKEGDADRMKEISQYANVVKFTGKETFDVDVAIYSTCWSGTPEANIKAKKYVQMIHADFEVAKKSWNFQYTKMPKVTDHVCVGLNAQKALKKVYGYDSTVIFNILDNELENDKILRLITVSRLAAGKGLERMSVLAHALKAKGIRFVWLFFGDSTGVKYTADIKKLFADLPEFVFMGTALNAQSYIADSDYLVQLSDSEGFCYSICEALQVGTACIVTDFLSATEQIENGRNGYILKMDMSNVDLDAIYKKIPKNFTFKEQTNEKTWLKFLEKPPRKLPIEKKRKYSSTTYKVTVKKEYFDNEKNATVFKGTVLEINEERFQLLDSMGLVSLAV